ncbi:MAG: outer membrane homotrimeric porin [Desulfovibrionaceae bacterium]|nr:outer membrane homotrimeric porin [Desulfovibrionaceae bacterium]
MLNKFKKSCLVVMLAAGMLLGANVGAQAVDFKAKGEWRIAFGLGNAQLKGGHGVQKHDLFGATQRLRLQLDAVASENLSGRVWFEIGYQDWGNAGSGGALGADGIQVKVKNAYLDWIVPETDLKLRMGIQNVTLPNAAGGSSIMGATDIAGITGSYQFTDEVGLTAFWYRPVNDNFNGSTKSNGEPRYDEHYLDNIDLFGLAVPLSFEGVEVTPWAMYGMMGRNALYNYNTSKGGLGRAATFNTPDGALGNSLFANVGYQGIAGNLDIHNGTRQLNGARRGFRHTKAYSSLFFFGLPIKVTAFDPINVEFEFDYGYFGGFGKDYVWNYRRGFAKNADSSRSGWLIKALVEYKMDWGVPGIFGWYGSGDDGDIKNGSERMPSIKANQKFTSFTGAAGQDFYQNSNFKGGFNETMCSLAGTWGVGLQVRDMEFLEDLKHTFRVAYIGGTNDPSMVRYFRGAGDWAGTDGYEGPYLTKNDGLVEFNLDNTYKIYDNLQVGFDLGYIINCVDKGTWNHSRRWDANAGDRHFSKHDAWKAQLTFNYTF